MRREPVLILGGGPAGSAAAITLAHAGERPLVLERQRETGDALCGGFLSWHSLEVLERLGAPKLRGATVDHVRLFTPHGCARVALPAPSLGLSRRQFDSTLLNHADALGARVERGVLAREIEVRRIRTDQGEFEADHLLLACGKHDVRGVARPKLPGDPALGLRVRLSLTPALAAMIGSAIELHLFDRGYAGLVSQEDGSANLCLAVRKSRLAEEGGPRALIDAIGREVPALGERLAWLASDTEIDAIAAIPYGWRATDTRHGLYRLGDQAGVIPSLAGEGMGIALASGIMAAHAVLNGQSAPDYQRALAGRTRRPIAVARVVLAAAERPASATLMMRLMRSAPGLAAMIARATRLRH